MVKINWLNSAKIDLKNIYDFIANDLFYFIQSEQKIIILMVHHSSRKFIMRWQ